MSRGSGGNGWVFYILILVAINAASYYFNWGWTFW